MSESISADPRREQARRPLLVTAALILRQTTDASEVLIARRKLSASSEPGKWEFPGGKVEFAENPTDTLQREILEELGLSIQVGSLFSHVSHVYRKGQPDALHIVMLCYLCRLSSLDADGVFRLHDAADARWVSAETIHRIANPYLNPDASSDPNPAGANRREINSSELGINDFAEADHPVLKELDEYLTQVISE